MKISRIQNIIIISSVLFLLVGLYIIVFSKNWPFYRSNRKIVNTSTVQTTAIGLSEYILTTYDKKVEDWSLYQPRDDVLVNNDPCPNRKSDFAILLSKVNEGPRQVLSIGGSYTLISSPNYGNWTTEGLSAAVQDPAAYCDTPVIVPFRAYADRILWKSNCQSGAIPSNESSWKQAFTQCNIVEQIVDRHFHCLDFGGATCTRTFNSYDFQVVGYPFQVVIPQGWDVHQVDSYETDIAPPKADQKRGIEIFLLQENSTDFGTAANISWYSLPNDIAINTLHPWFPIDPVLDQMVTIAGRSARKISSATSEGDYDHFAYAEKYLLKKDANTVIEILVTYTTRQQKVLLGPVIQKILDSLRIQ